jgi:hypothetical protein
VAELRILTWVEPPLITLLIDVGVADGPFPAGGAEPDRAVAPVPSAAETPLMKLEIE